MKTQLSSKSAAHCFPRKANSVWLKVYRVSRVVVVSLLAGVVSRPALSCKAANWFSHFLFIPPLPASHISPYSVLQCWANVLLAKALTLHSIKWNSAEQLSLCCFTKLLRCKLTASKSCVSALVSTRQGQLESLLHSSCLYGSFLALYCKSCHL